MLSLLVSALIALTGTTQADTTPPVQTVSASGYVEVVDLYNVKDSSNDWAMLRAAYKACEVNNFDAWHAYECQVDAYVVATDGK